MSDFPKVDKFFVTIGFDLTTKPLRAVAGSVEVLDVAKHDNYWLEDGQVPAMNADSSHDAHVMIDAFFLNGKFEIGRGNALTFVRWNGVMGPLDVEEANGKVANAVRDFVESEASCV